MLKEAIASYRNTFQPSKWLARPYFMMAAGVCGAETDEEAVYLRSSQVLAFARLRSGKPGKLPYPTRNLASEVPAGILAQVEAALSVSAVGSPSSIRDQLLAIVETYRPDELMLTGMIHDHAARVRSFEIAAEALTDRQTRKEPA